MSKRSDRLRQQAAMAKQRVEHLPEKPNKKITFSKFWKLIVGITLIATLVSNYQKIWDFFRLPKEKREELQFEDGYLKPLPLNLPDSTSTESTTHYNSNGIQDTLIEKTDTSFGKNNSYPMLKGIFIKDLIKKKSIRINLGSNIYDASPAELIDGKNLGSPLGWVDMGIIIGVINDRLYVSLDMSDLQNENHIGTIYFNHWTLYVPNLLTYYDDDYRLEVRDKQNNIVLAVKYNQDADNPEVSIAGYFISPKKILIIPNDLSHPTDLTYGGKEGKNWKQLCLERIKRIKTIFPENR